MKKNSLSILLIALSVLLVLSGCNLVEAFAKDPKYHHGKYTGSCTRANYTDATCSASMNTQRELHMEINKNGDKAESKLIFDKDGLASGSVTLPAQPNPVDAGVNARHDSGKITISFTDSTGGAINLSK